MESFEDNACVEGQAGHTLQIYSDPTDLISPFLAGAHSSSLGLSRDHPLKWHSETEAEILFFMQGNMNVKLLATGIGSTHEMVPISSRIDTILKLSFLS